MAWFDTIGEYFEEILFVLLVVTLLMWLADKFYFSRRRRQAAEAALLVFGRRMGEGAGTLLTPEIQQQEREKLRQHHLQQPLWLEYSAGFFPVILLVFLLRSFVAEPFKIPSGSMLPTLWIGDMILVNKFAYGIRLPILNQKIIEIGEPQRGDVMVFRYPKNPVQKYIKRVVGLPGDIVSYQNKRLTINGQLIPVKEAGEFFDTDRFNYAERYTEQLGKVNHFFLNNKERPAFINPELFPNREACHYGASGVVCTVPAHQYFMMGDNRDNSADSRYWGFVPEANIVGKAFFIWMNFSHWKRIGMTF